jgi:hypothetical protein
VETVKRHPFNLVALLRLLEGGMSAKEVLALSERLHEATWLHSTFQGYAALAKHEYDGIVIFYLFIVYCSILAILPAVL